MTHKANTLLLMIALWCTPSPGTPLTWEQCVKEATEKSADLQASREALDKSESQLSSSHGGFLPQVTGTASYTRSGSGGTVGTTGGNVTTTGAGDQFSAGVNVTQNVFNGFQDKAAIERARAARNGSEAALQGQKAKLHQDLKRAFVQLLYAQRALALSQSIEKRRKGNLDLVELRFNGGRENKGSYLRSRASHGRAQFEVGEGARNLRVAQRQLARLLGRDIAEPLEVEGTMETRPTPEMPKDFAALSRRTPAFRQASAELKAAEESASQATGALMPSLAVNGSVSRTGANFPPGTDRWSVGVTLSVPLFRWNLYGDIGAARAEARRAEAAQRSAREQAQVRLEETYAALANGAERVTVQKQTVEAAQLRAEIARGQYGSGLVSYNDWDLIENDLIVQEQALLAARRDAVLAEAAWEQALGNGDIL